MSELTMSAMALTGHGGPEKLEWRTDLPRPVPKNGEVLIRTLASAVNNTDINTRIGWYSKSVTGDTAEAAQSGAADTDDAGWSGNALSFPLIQGADCCGRIVGVGPGVDEGRIGERVLVRALQTRQTDAGPVTWTFGSECNGGFAEYAVARSFDALAVVADWDAGELASLPCAYSTAEGMLQRAGVGAEDVLITGASGGVGSAAIQLAKLRGATVTAVAGAKKADEVRGIGADHVLDREADFGADRFDVVVDLVAGPRWPNMIDALRRGGRYVVSGAIAGPIVEMDVRTLYLRDLTYFGSTLQPDNILPDVIRYVEKGLIRPLIAAPYALADLHAAQEAFLAKGYVGKIVLKVGDDL